MRNGCQILLVEDEALIAMDIEAHLIDHGFSVAGPCATVSEALAAVEKGGLSVGILDVHLRGESSVELAKRLLSMKIPVIFLSGAVEIRLPGELTACPVLSKPIDYSNLVATIDSRIA